MFSQKYYLINRDYYSRYSKGYYNKYKEEIKECDRNRYNSLSPKEKQKKIDYSRNYLNLPEHKKKVNEKMKAKYHNMSDEDMQKHKKYQKTYPKKYRAKKKQELENSKKAQGLFW